MSDKHTKYGDEDLARILMRRTSVSRTAEAFGEAIIRASFLEAAELLKDGKAVQGIVEFPAKVKIRYIPDPSSIDVCFEECIVIGKQSAVQCYVECNAPKLPDLIP